MTAPFARACSNFSWPAGQLKFEQARANGGIAGQKMGQI